MEPLFKDHTQNQTRKIFKCVCVCVRVRAGVNINDRFEMEEKKEQCFLIRVVQELHPNGCGNGTVMVYSNSLDTNGQN